MTLCDLVALFDLVMVFAETKTITKSRLHCMLNHPVSCKTLNKCGSQTKYPVLHYGTLGGTGFLFLGRLVSRASTEQKFWASYGTSEGGLFMFSEARGKAF